ncbi:MAG: sigma-54-dependent Fis family transcriptional regulator [Myxococcales bacterium]|nr:sigma-54-dependent Fis family transcriptional regulator [Myxococcales bacterium]
MGRVLVVDDERGLREGLVKAVERLGHQAVAAEGVVEARRRIEAERFDCVLLDVRLKDGDGIALLEAMRGGLAPEVPVIMATAYGDSDRTIRAMRAGAFDYATKPFDLPSLLDMVQRAIRQRELKPAVERPVESAAPRAEAPGDLVGASAAMLQVWKFIGRAAASDAPVLITGETGTGKERVAEAIHRNSARSRAPFVAVNLAALPPTLIESELFGHERGAFTGAVARKAGRIELAADGTLFLDEIGDLEPGLQTRLLRVLQSQGYERVGGTESLTMKCRVIAATHRPVRPGEAGSTLRDDLYYRLAVLEVALPPLRARKSDIALLVAHALKGTHARAVSEEAIACLQRYDWPGNVRELLHSIARAAAMTGGEVIDAQDLPEAIQRGRAGPEQASGGVDPTEEFGSLREAVAALERRMILKALERAKGNRAEAARSLGIARPQLYAKLDEHGLGKRGERDEG